MRVLTAGNMYPPHHLGGYELMWRSSVNQLRRRGHDVRVLTTDYRNPEPDDGGGEDEDVHRELRWYWHDHAWPRLSLAERWRLERHNQGTLARHLEEFRPEVVAWWAMGGMSMALIERVRRAGLPAAAIVVDDWLLYAPREDQWQRAVRRLGPARRLGILAGVPSRLCFDREIEWVFVSRAMLDNARRGGWEVPRHTIAYAGVDRTLFKPLKPRAWGWRLLCVGRIDPRKGLGVAIDALATLPEASLRIIGSGDEEHLDALRARARERGLGDRVVFDRLPREALPRAYADADAVLFPVQWEEPFGIVPLEAMAVGRPVVATGTGGSGEYLADGENCVIYSPRDDAAKLADAIRRLATDDAMRERVRSGGGATAARLDEDAFNTEVENALKRATREC